MIKYVFLTLLLITLNVNANEVKQVIPETPLENYSEYIEFLYDHPHKIFILINRGSQQLLVVEEDDITLRMKVIVGKSGWTTPIQPTSITHVITNPYWNVPTSIGNSVKRKMEKTPDKAKRQGYRTSYRRDGSIRYFQLPGPANALGKVKFKLDNIGSIYMHDTPSKHLFKRSNRKLSHGCIRLEKPLELLSIISPIEYKSSRNEKWHNLPDPIPVYIVDWGK